MFVRLLAIFALLRENKSFKLVWVNYNKQSCYTSSMLYYYILPVHSTFFVWPFFVYEIRNVIQIFKHHKYFNIRTLFTGVFVFDAMATNILAENKLIVLRSTVSYYRKSYLSELETVVAKTAMKYEMLNAVRKIMVEYFLYQYCYPSQV